MIYLFFVKPVKTPLHDPTPKANASRNTVANVMQCALKLNHHHGWVNTIFYLNMVSISYARRRLKELCEWFVGVERICTKDSLRSLKGARNRRMIDAKKVLPARMKE